MKSIPQTRTELMRGGAGNSSGSHKHEFEMTVDTKVSEIDAKIELIDLEFKGLRSSGIADNKRKNRRVQLKRRKRLLIAKRHEILDSVRKNHSLEWRFMQRAKSMLGSDQFAMILNAATVDIKDIERSMSVNELRCEQ